MSELSQRMMVTGGNVTGITDSWRRKVWSCAVSDPSRPPRLYA